MSRTQTEKTGLLGSSHQTYTSDQSINQYVQQHDADHQPDVSYIALSSPAPSAPDVEASISPPTYESINQPNNQAVFMVPQIVSNIQPIKSRFSGERYAPLCRLCGHGHNIDDLMIPCLCAYPNAWVHRDCLDAWRAENIYRPDFKQCQSCNFVYTIDEQMISAAEIVQSRHRWKAVGKVVIIVLSFVFSLFLMTLFIGLIDQSLGSPIQRTWPGTSAHLGWYWLLALAIALAIIGVIGLIAFALGNTTVFDQNSCWVIWWCPNSSPSAPRSQNGGGSSGTSDCGNCGGGGGGEACLVMIAVFAVVGICCCFFIGAHIVKRVVAVNFQRTWYRVETDRQPVKDWSYDREGLTKQHISPEMV